MKIYQIKKITQYQSNPSALFSELCADKKSTLLFESAEVVNKKGIQSLLILQSALRVVAEGRKVTLTALTPNGEALLPYLQTSLPDSIQRAQQGNQLICLFPEISTELDEESRLKSTSVLDILRSLLHLAQKNSNVDEQGIFLGGLFSYDLVAQFEPLPTLESSQHCPDFCFYLAETLLVLNHQTQRAELKSTLFTDCSQERDRLTRGMDALDEKITQFSKQKITGSTQKTASVDDPSASSGEIHSNLSDAEYKAIITKLQHAIHQGEIFQIVPSRRFYLPCPNPIQAYHILKQNNPSPYMFMMQDELFSLFGASPESALKYTQKSNEIEIYPIAGTKPRGLNAQGEIDRDLDSRIELAMRTDQKELAEHLMLVDLARNDLARICEPGSRYVKELLKVDRYSHVMHLVSHLVGQLRSDLDALHAYQATMNMGTLTGAPKVRAMQLIAEVEQERRGSYGGAIGYINGAGDLDTCIVIRSAYVEEGVASVQAGAGVVMDSDPHSEVEESKNKAQAVIKAIRQSLASSSHHNNQLGAQ